MYIIRLLIFIVALSPVFAAHISYATPTWADETCNLLLYSSPSDALYWPKQPRPISPETERASWRRWTDLAFRTPPPEAPHYGLVGYTDTHLQLTSPYGSWQTNRFAIPTDRMTPIGSPFYFMVVAGPNIANAFGWRNNDKYSIDIPNAAELNWRIEVINRYLTETNKLAFRFRSVDRSHYASGLVPTRAQLEALAEGFAYYADQHSLMALHDFNYHAAAFLFLPPEFLNRIQQQAQILIKFIRYIENQIPLANARRSDADRFISRLILKYTSRIDIGTGTFTINIARLRQFLLWPETSPTISIQRSTADVLNKIIVDSYVGLIWPQRSGLEFLRHLLTYPVRDASPNSSTDPISKTIPIEVENAAEHFFKQAYSDPRYTDAPPSPPTALLPDDPQLQAWYLTKFSEHLRALEAAVSNHQTP